MIEVRCTGCEALLRVRDELRGKVGACPKCKARVHIPGEAGGFDVIEDDDGNVPVIHAKRRGAMLPAPRQLREKDDDDVDERPRQVRRRKRRRSGIDSDKTLVMIISGATAFAVICCFLSLAHWAFLFPPLMIGVIMSATAGIWQIIVAFREDTVCGLLYLFVPFYPLYYLVTRWDEMKRPFFLHLIASLILIVSAVCIAAVAPPPEKNNRNRDAWGQARPADDLTLHGSGPINAT